MAAKLTQQRVAEERSLQRQTISSWEAGRTLPDLLEFRELVALYGVSADKVLATGAYSPGSKVIDSVRQGRPPRDFEESKF